MKNFTRGIAIVCLGLAAASSGMARKSAPLLPDPSLTPGDTLDVTKDDICIPGYAKKVRDVPVELKRQVYAEYGIVKHKPGEFEVDHLISLELGGSNALKNLWPQSYRTKPWNAHIKDALEDHLHREVCSGALDLKTAQQAISRDWIAAYRRYMPAKSRGTTRKQPKATENFTTGVADNRVWVNTRSGKYFRTGSKYYGKTKQGVYMTEAQAKQQGYIPAK